MQAQAQALLQQRASWRQKPRGRRRARQSRLQGLPQALRPSPVA
jgi:hypothetical protein